MKIEDQQQIGRELDGFVNGLAILLELVAAKVLAHGLASLIHRVEPVGRAVEALFDLGAEVAIEDLNGHALARAARVVQAKIELLGLLAPLAQHQLHVESVHLAGRAAGVLDGGETGQERNRGGIGRGGNRRRGRGGARGRFLKQGEQEESDHAAQLRCV